MDRTNKSLWTEEQVSVNGLKNSYKLSELFFIYESGLAGVVFLQNSDPFFWPEVTESDSLFIHKLAVLPARSGEQLGKEALNTITDYTKERGFKWVRLDCDDRPELHNFYKRSGFALVDIKQMGKFRVSRYQLLTK
ncbi:GNAT family N-acetyltransferase [Gynuella sp.]|uniref:GNAT family N-acetyltransferase n=1 Tax=Gynuella sp. TaxID=2969146 RepID=UPI003D0CF36A